jgi:peptidyl-tRNA hydrolase
MKLYIVSRQDLPPGAQCAQSVHAAFAFAQEHPELTRDWHLNSNNIVILAARNEQDLALLIEKARHDGVEFSAFREPDFDDALTAVALAPRGKKLVQKIPLALAA